MNKKLMGALLVLSFPLTAIAIEPPQADSGSIDKSQKIERLAKALGLNQEQKAKIESIVNDQKAKLKAMPEEKRAHLQSILKQELDKVDHHKQSLTGKGGGSAAP
jgi:Spy/CpxP family protein refolding chaperone